MQGAFIKGVGKALPSYYMTNDEMSNLVETSNEWIESRTGIIGRYVSKGETTTSLAIEASKEAIEKAEIDPLLIDLIIVATMTPDYVMPSTACLVQEAIGANHATCFDLTAACSGFIYASKVAVESIQNGNTQYALIIGAETLSRTVDWQDRSTCVLFGDGAGAAIFAKNDVNHILNIKTGSNGAGGDALTLEGRALSNCFVSDEQTPSYMKMNGQSVYRFATTTVPKNIELLLSETPYTASDIDYFVLHQANSRIMDSVASKLKVAEDKFYKNLSTHGNTSAASVPMALYDLVPKLKPNDKVILSGFGGGLTWGSMLICW